MSETVDLPRVEPGRRLSPARRAYGSFLRTAVGRGIAMNVASRVDPWLLRRTRGRLGMGLMLPSALLTTTGARSGAERTATVLYFHDGDDVILVASSFGRDRHPAWFHNLVANPEVRIAKGGGGPRMRAAPITDPAELDRVWALADQVYPPYADYRRRAGAAGRTIPLVRLTAPGA
ncbi:MAG: nitroreductase family deazaflavin-dependent oxidoreductase [Solirubrobacteraceae bacterium]|nr:nitroreductase family deazaflavin-dependent oxidoreductase [Solirubrobacteraceae bacterium]